MAYPAAGPRSTILPMNGGAFDWRLWGGALLAGGAIVAAALAMPVPPLETGAGAGGSDRLPGAVAEPAPEDLAAFLEIRRWGAPPAKAPEPEPEAAEPALNPVLAAMGFVGLIAVQDQRAVLLALPEGDIVRMLPGDTLPDGRILVSVTDNRLTLKSGAGSAEVLTLFPPLPAEAGPVVDAGGGAADGGNAALSPGPAEAPASR